MKKKLNRILCILFAVALCCSLNSVAYAKEGVSVRLSAILELNGDLPSQKDSFAVVIKNDDTGEQYCSTINGEGEISLEPLELDTVGIYNYTIEQATGSNENCSYDNSVYHARITVVNAENEGLNFSIAVYKDGETDKQDCILFTNSYKSDKTTEATTQTTKETTTKETTIKETTTEEKTGDYSNPKNPNTGDNTRGPILFALIAVGSATIICLAVPKRKREETE